MKLKIQNHNEIELKRVVVKLGTKQITDLNEINWDNLQRLVSQIVSYRQKGVEFIIVASGAIGLAVHHFYKSKTAIPKLSVSQKQALAAFGQISLMELFRSEFQKHNLSVGQVLLTHYILENRNTYQNARNTLNAMLSMGIVPIINENDSVAIDEIQFGDNDRLGAYVSLLIDADLYVMLSDIDGLYEDYYSENKRLIKVVDNIAQVFRLAEKKEEAYTKGGMETKLIAAKIATVGGVPTVIANGFKTDILCNILEDLQEGTIFLPIRDSLSDKKRWISSKKPKGRILIDDGAVKAVLSHKSLLASGIIEVIGNFKKGDTVLIANQENQEIAIGLCNYSSDEAIKIRGLKNSEIQTLFNDHQKHSSVIHIDNMTVFENPKD